MSWARPVAVQDGGAGSPWMVGHAALAVKKERVTRAAGAVAGLLHSLRACPM